MQRGTATTIVLSSVVHEIYSYNGYDKDEVRRALGNATAELAPGGRVLVRDGVSWGNASCRLRFLNEQTRAQWQRFAVEFKHGAGAAHERLGDDEVRLTRHLANEFLCKKDYLKNWHIEVHEEYGDVHARSMAQRAPRSGPATARDRRVREPVDRRASLPGHRRAARRRRLRPAVAADERRGRRREAELTQS